MKTKHFKPIALLISIFQCALNSWAQEVTIEQAYTNFYKYPREKIVVQLNKTTFLPGESIWFQAYLIDPKSGMPSGISNNIYAGIFDANGKLIKHKLLFAEDGIAGGNFPIDSTFIGNEFTLKMFTRWMLNFDENLDFNQRIFVIQNDLYPNPIAKNHTTPFVVNVFNEGDSGFVENTLNNLIFTLTDAIGQQVEIETGKVLDESGKVVAEITEATEGIGRTAFFIESDKKYCLQLTAYNGMVAEKKILPIKKQGFIMNVNNLDPKKLIVRVYNNFPDDIPTDSLNYELAIEKDGYIFTKPLNLEAGKNLTVNLDKSVFTTGVYTAYLIKNGKILAKRPFFNQDDRTLLKPAITVLKAAGDSLQLQLNANAGFLVFSASLLPENTGALLKKSSLPQQLFPGLADYFDNDLPDDRALLSQLDLNLITRSKSGSLWENRFNEAIKMDYLIEKGISFRGKIKLKNGKQPKGNILVFTESMSFQQTIVPNKDGSFESKHNYLEDGAVLKVALIDDKKKLKKPELEFFEVFPDVREVLTDHSAQPIDEQALTILNQYSGESSAFPLIEGEKK